MTEPLTPTVEVEVKEVYARIAAAWEQHKGRLFDGACGYSILGSRPLLTPKLLILGENPGFGAEDFGNGPHIYDQWPDASYLDGETWPLKDRLREMFRSAKLEDVLREAVLSNFLFFKSSSHSRESNYRWSSLDASLRHDLERLCLKEVKALTLALRPKQIMVLGLSAFDRHANDIVTLAKARDGKRRLCASGKVFGIDAFAIMHPTGARWHEDDRKEGVRQLQARVH